MMSKKSKYKPVWLKRRLARGQKPREEIVESMFNIARDNNGLIPLLKSSSIHTNRRLASMIQDDLVTIYNIRSNCTRSVVALDCEMVGVGPRGSRSALAKCSIVGYDGDIIYDSYIKPSEPITDFRTIFSGIQPCHMQHAKPFEVASREIKSILADKIIVGHALKNDFDAIGMKHPQSNRIRDTSDLAILQVDHIPSLRLLTKVCFNYSIQEGDHSSSIDALACMNIYKLFENSWGNKSNHVKYNDCFGEMCLPPTESCTIGTDDCELSRTSNNWRIMAYQQSSLKHVSTLTHSLPCACGSISRSTSSKPNNSSKPDNSKKKNKKKKNRKKKDKSLLLTPDLTHSKGFLKNLIGIHCDLVTMTSGKKQVARCTIVNGAKRVFFSSYILPDGEVKDWHLETTGLKMDKFLEYAKPLVSSVPEILKFLTVPPGRTIVGHGLKEQFEALNLCLNEFKYRDTAESLLVRQKAGLSIDHYPNLFKLSWILLCQKIKWKSAIRKTRAPLVIYKALAKEWEESLKKLTE